MDNDQIDTALVERVALAMQQEYAEAVGGGKLHHISESVLAPAWLRKAHAVIYPPAPPKTRMQVARELLADAYEATAFSSDAMAAEQAMKGTYDGGIAMKAIIAALALPAMED